MERRFAIQRVVFVTPKRRAGVMVDVVADEADLVLELKSTHRFLEQQIPGAIVAHDVNSGGAFGSAVLHVAHIDVHATPVKQKTAVAGGFVPVSIVQIDQPVAIIFKKPVAHARQHFLHLRRRLDQTPILGFESCNSLRHSRPISSLVWKC